MAVYQSITVLTLLMLFATSRETESTVDAVLDLSCFHWVPKVQPAEDMQTMTHMRLTISLAVRVIS